MFLFFRLFKRTDLELRFLKERHFFVLKGSVKSSLESRHCKISSHASLIPLIQERGFFNPNSSSKILSADSIKGASASICCSIKSLCFLVS